MRETVSILMVYSIEVMKWKEKNNKIKEREKERNYYYYSDYSIEKRIVIKYCFNDHFYISTIS